MASPTQPAPKNAETAATRDPLAASSQGNQQLNPGNLQGRTIIQINDPESSENSARNPLYATLCLLLSFQV